MRRGQFYMIDAFFAAAIIFIGIGLLLSDQLYTPEQRQVQTTASDVVSLLFNTPLSDIDNSYVDGNYVILEETYVPMQQAHYWLNNASQGCSWCEEEARIMIQSIVGGIVGEQFGYEISIDYGGKTVLFSQETIPEPQILIANKQILLTEVNDTTIIGPSQAEVRVWQ